MGIRGFLRQYSVFVLLLMFLMVLSYVTFNLVKEEQIIKKKQEIIEQKISQPKNLTMENEVWDFIKSTNHFVIENKSKEKIPFVSYDKKFLIL